MNPDSPQEINVLSQLIDQVRTLTIQNQNLMSQLNQIQSAQNLVNRLNPDSAQSRTPASPAPSPVQIKFQDVEKFAGTAKGVNVMAWLDSNRRRHNNPL